MARGGSGAEAPPLATRPGLQEQEREVAIAYMWRIHMETGPRRVAEAIAGTAQIQVRCGRWLTSACRTSSVVAGVRVSHCDGGVLRGSNDVSKGAKLDVFDTRASKPVGVTPCHILWRYSKGFMPRVKRGSFVLQRANKPTKV